MPIRRSRPAQCSTEMCIFVSRRGVYTELRRTTYNIRLDSQYIELLFVITPGFGRVISDEEDAFL